MPEYLILSLCGCFGAAMYGFPVFIAALRAVPPEKFSLIALIFTMTVGAVCAPILVPELSKHWPVLASGSPYPLALGVGLAVNPLTPILLKRFTTAAENVNIGTKK